MLPLASILTETDPGLDRDQVGPAGMGWRHRAACRNQPVDLDWFFPSSGEAARSLTAAREVCDVCPVKPECLAYGLASEQMWGVWGGVLADSVEWRALGGRPRNT
ncbi:WhiB family transcriptional regulator [Streptomyces sp. cg36]|uniref:WhiB family transcriptional regulator n=1 Tax=Streptomyces sp. cg36 TaxID=3238798 RepID=UPI0034E21EA5